MVGMSSAIAAYPSFAVFDHADGDSDVPFFGNVLRGYGIDSRFPVESFGMA